MNQWPGVRLRVTEGWDEEGHHASDSLHYEGRAVDVTTSDRDRSKYGMLARLAVEAGFDWVYYESRAHIHCSVKSESSEAAKYGGCFAGENTVQTSTGKQKLSELQIGQKVLAIDTGTNQLVFSEVLMFLDWDPLQRRDFVKLNLASGKTLTITPSHLVITKSVNFSMPVFAETLIVGNTLIVYNRNGNQFEDTIVNVTRVFRTGVFAPLTSVGTIIVNDVLVSCYAVVNSHLLAHWAFAPIRLIFNARDILYKFWNMLRHPFMGWLIDTVPKPSYPSRGVHWYPKVLYRITEYFIPWQILYK